MIGQFFACRDADENGKPVHEYYYLKKITPKRIAGVYGESKFDCCLDFTGRALGLPGEGAGAFLFIPL
jgi:hypothetical protein